MANKKIVDGFVFTQDERTGYYLGTVNGHHLRLHQYIWIREKGPIPKGYDVHHIDFNKENNDFENLTLLTRSEHHKIHGKIVPTKVIKCKICGTIAIRRHNSLFCSNACKSKWRREAGIDDITVKCHACGEEFRINKYRARRVKRLFCSHSCASRYLIAEGIMPCGRHGRRKRPHLLMAQGRLAI